VEMKFSTYAIDNGKIIFKIPSLKLAIKGWQLAKKSFSEESKKNIVKQQWKSFFGILFNPIIAAKWFSILESSLFKVVSQYRQRLYFKPFRVYMSIKWTNGQKIKIIEDTYRFLKLNGNIFVEFLTQKGGLELSRFKLNEVSDGIITLGYDERFRKEGELVCTFSCNELGGKLVAGAFSFEQLENEKWVCRIGCVQGYSNDFDNSFKVAQKQMHGLRPKSLIIYAIQELARQMGCVEIYGAGDSIQAYRRKHLIHIPWRHSIQFDYNAIWTESEGKPVSEGWYKLPLIPARKSYDQIKPNKRSLYNKRFALLEAVSINIENQVKNRS